MLEKIKQVVLAFENSDEAISHLGYWYMHDFQTTGRRPVVDISDLEIIWSVKVLQNWKVCIRSKVTAPNLFYECTYNGNTDELYIDVYLRFGSDVQVVGTAFNFETVLTIDDIKKSVYEYVKQHIYKTDDVKFTVDDIYTVWTSMDVFDKCVHTMLSTTLPDGMYYEARFNANKNDICFKAYKKLKNYTVANFTKEEKSNEVSDS